MDYRFYKLGDDFCKRAKGVEQAKEIMTDVVNLMQREILEGKKSYRSEYYMASLSLWEIDTANAMLYLEVLRHSQEELTHEAGVQNVSSTMEVRRLTQRALDVCNEYEQMCKELDENKKSVQAVLDDYNNGVNGVTLENVYGAYFGAVNKHVELRAKALEFVQEGVLPISDRCEQYAFDLRHLNEDEDLRRLRAGASQDEEDDECGLQ